MLTHCRPDILAREHLSLLHRTDVWSHTQSMSCLVQNVATAFFTKPFQTISEGGFWIMLKAVGRSYFARRCRWWSTNWPRLDPSPQADGIWHRVLLWRCYEPHVQTVCWSSCQGALPSVGLLVACRPQLWRHREVGVVAGAGCCCIDVSSSLTRLGGLTRASSPKVRRGVTYGTTALTTQLGWGHSVHGNLRQRVSS